MKNPSDLTPDLSGSFNPVPKVYKAKKPKKGLNKIGPKGQNSLDAVSQLKVTFSRYGIKECELRYDGCWKDNALTFAHVDKRRFLSAEDVRNPNMVVLACTPCHAIVEQWPRKEMKEELEKVIEKREYA